MFLHSSEIERWTSSVQSAAFTFPELNKPEPHLFCTGFLQNPDCKFISSLFLLIFTSEAKGFADGTEER